jgi:hypothetical protein
MERIDNILRALEDRGRLLEPAKLALVWIDSPDAGCFVRAGDVRRIEAFYRGKSQVWSRVSVTLPDDSIEILIDSRRPKAVAAAVRKAEKQATATLLDEVRNRFGGLTV